MAKKHYSFGINLAPFIDVIFILLAFMLIYAKLDTAQFIEVELPQTQGKALERPSNMVIITIAADNAFFWNGTEILFENLPASLNALMAENTIIIQADRKSDSEALIKLMNLLSQHKISAAQIAVIH